MSNDNSYMPKNLHSQKTEGNKKDVVEDGQNKEPYDDELIVEEPSFDDVLEDIKIEEAENQPQQEEFIEGTKESHGEESSDEPKEGIIKEQGEGLGEEAAEESREESQKEYMDELGEEIIEETYVKRKASIDYDDKKDRILDVSKHSILTVCLAVVFAGISIYLCKNGFIGIGINTIFIVGMLIFLMLGFGSEKKGIKGLEICTDDLNNAIIKIHEFDEKPDLTADQFIHNEELFQSKTLKKAFIDYQNEMIKLRNAGSYQACDIADYINEELLDQVSNASFNSLVGGMMTGLGILGTFIGLAVGLSNFKMESGATSDPGAMMDSINSLIEGIKTAFLTSIYGIVYSLYYNGYFGVKRAKASETLEEFLNTYYDVVCSRPENEAFTRLIELQEQQKNSMNQMAEDISISFSEHIKDNLAPLFSDMREAMNAQTTNLPEAISNAISDSIIPTLQGIEERISQLADHMADVQDQNMGKIAEDFVAHMDEAMGHQFENLGNSIKVLCDWQENMSNQVQSLVEEMTSSGEKLILVNQDLQKSIEGFDGYLTKLDTCQNGVNESFKDAMNRFKNLFDLIESFQESMAGLLEMEKESYSNLDRINSLFEEQANSFSVALEKQSEIMESQMDAIKEELDRQSELMLNFYAYQREELQKSSAIISESLLKQSQSYMETLNNQSSQMITSIEEKSLQLARIMDAAAENLITEFNNVRELHQSLMEGMDTASNSMRASSRAMVDASQDLTRNLDSAMERTYEQIDKQLSEIVLHLSGTLTELKDITERIPKVVKLSTDSSMDTMEQYLNTIEQSQREINNNLKELKERKA